VSQPGCCPCDDEIPRETSSRAAGPGKRGFKQPGCCVAKDDDLAGEQPGCWASRAMSAQKSPAIEIIERGASDFAEANLLRLTGHGGDLVRSAGEFAVDGFKDFLTMDGDFLRGDDAKANLVPADFHDRYDDVIVNDDRLIFFSGQY